MPCDYHIAYFVQSFHYKSYSSEGENNTYLGTLVVCDRKNIKTDFNFCKVFSVAKTCRSTRSKRITTNDGGSISKVGRPKTNDQIFSPSTRTGSGVARNFKRGDHHFHIYFQRLFFGRTNLKLIRNKKNFSGVWKHAPPENF